MDSSQTPLGKIVPDILVLIFEQIASLNDLFNVSLVSCQYNQLVTPLLYRHVQFKGHIIPYGTPEKNLKAFSALRSLIENILNYKNYVKTLEVTYFTEDILNRDTFQDLSFEDLVIRAVENCKSLERLKYNDSTLTPKIISTFQALSNINTVHIDLHKDRYFNSITDPRPSNFLSISGFRNITSLEIYGIYGPLRRYQNDLASCLAANPLLSTFGLSIAPNAIDDSESEEQFSEFFESLCLNYSQLSTVRLPIQHLILGQGIFLDFDSPENSISTLLNISYLTVIDIEETSQEWSQLDSANSLKSISLSTVYEEFLDFLESFDGKLEKLHVTETIDDDKDLTRLLEILSSTEIQDFQLHYERSLDEDHRDILAKCASLRYLQITLGEYDTPCTDQTLSCLVILTGLRKLGLNNLDNQNFIQHAISELLKEGYLPELREVCIWNDKFKVLRLRETPVLERM